MVIWLVFRQGRKGWQVVRLSQYIDRGLQSQRGALMPWTPVFLGLGTALYFSLPTEPGRALYIALLATTIAVGFLSRLDRERLGPPVTGLIMILLGLMISGFRTHEVAGPVLDFRYYGPIEGRIVAIDRSASDRVRLTLDEVRLDRVDPERTPRRVRVSLFGNEDYFDPSPGVRVMLTGHLSPPEGPGEPGGFDFQRHAWFLSLGGVGYSRVPALALAPRREGEMWLADLRARLSNFVSDGVGGTAGAFATAVVTGDRSGIPQEVLTALRQSNIAHLLAISGLHMGLLTGFVFLCLRGGLALVPRIALYVPTKKIAAVGALLAGAGYLAISGGNVATERAFIQVAVMFTAILIDRRAITLRSVAIAALIVLVHRPETLMGPGFQMSFAATAALVAVFNGLKTIEALRGMPTFLRGFFGLVVSSIVAGLATAPFAAAHFNMLAAYGLLANLLTVPVMGSIVVPAAVLAALLAPFGLERIGFWAMEQGLLWIISVAEFVSNLPGAVRPIVMPPGYILGMISVGALLLIIWQGRGRWLGALPVAAALLFWTGAERADLLVSASGRLAGVMTDEGRAFSRPRGDGFVARLWLENDGDLISQQSASERAAWQDDGAGRILTLPSGALWHGVGRRAEEDIARACAEHLIVITSETPPEALLADPLLIPSPARNSLMAFAEGATPATCQILSPEVLRQTGSVAIYFEEGGLRMVSARALQGARPWVPNR